MWGPTDSRELSQKDAAASTEKIAWRHLAMIEVFTGRSRIL
jgi:hypothetical protein